MHNTVKNRGLHKNLIIAGLFAALAIALNYVLIYIPQVKLFNLVIFAAGYFGGIYTGAVSGAAASLIYFTFNPFGMSPLPLLTAQVFSMALIGTAGGICRKYNIFSGSRFMVIAKAALIGLVLSVIYNFIVTASGAYLFGAFREAFVMAVPFMLINIGTNIIAFAVLVPLILPLEKRFRG